MNRLGLLAVAVLGLSVGARAADAPPNIVFLLADDLGRADCGFMGGKAIRTPNLDKLAASGATLDAHYVQPVCSPTRAALMTGRYPMRHGLQVGVVRPWAQYGLPLGERTLPLALKQAGYATAIVGKWHLGHFQRAYLPTRRGFDHQYGHYNGALDYFTHERDGGFDWHRDDQVCRDEGYTTRLLAREAVKFIEANAGRRPFFLYVPFNAVHAPHQAPEETIRTYPDLRGNRRIYAAMLSEMDDAVGAIVGALERAGARSNTLFVFSSDNGGPSPGKITDNGIYRAGKGTLFEGGVRVVAFASWDGHIPAGTVVKEPLHAVDWYPTLVRLAGASADQPLPVDGVDAWPTLSEGKPMPERTILLNTSPKNGAVRRGDWKLIVHHDEVDRDNPPARAGRNARAAVELYNLSADPSETNNLADREPETLRSLRDALEAFASQAVAPKERPKPADFVVPRVWGEAD